MRGGTCQRTIARRRFLQLACGAAALPALPRAALAQAYPARPVRLMVGFAAGQAIDILARLIGQSLSERLGPQFIVEKPPGARGNIALDLVLPAPPAGRTLPVIRAHNAIKRTLYQKLTFQFAPTIL